MASRSNILQEINGCPYLGTKAGISIVNFPERNTERCLRLTGAFEYNMERENT
jgi:hypothetical protein